jgi:hypothetical protein
MKSSEHGFSFQALKSRPYLGVFGLGNAFMLSFLLKAVFQGPLK